MDKLTWLVKWSNYYYFKDKPVHASGITLDKDSITLTTAWQTEQLTATVTPEDAVNKKVIWTSSDTSVATVSSTGLVTCVTPGTCTITATCADSGANASCWVSSYVPKTFTISWTEQSNMSSGWTYSDDAAWLTAWSTDFDEFFWYSAVRLNTSWQETAEITQEQSWWAGKLDITQLWTLTSGDNVMIKFPVRWIKMTKNWSVVTLSITDWLGRESEWYQYYAHCTWTLSNPWTPKSAFYLWSYKASWYNPLRSWSWQPILASEYQSTFCTLAKANGSWYNIIGFYQRQYINALYIMKYWNPDSQSVIWKWYTRWSGVPTTWWTNNQTNATYWTSSATQQVKLFWLEDWWWWITEWVWGIYTDWNQQLYTMLSDWSWTLSWWEWTWTTIQHTWSYYNLSSIAGNNKAMFAPIATVNSPSYNTYYSDGVTAYASSLAYAGGSRNSEAVAWVLSIEVIAGTSAAGGYIGSRLMFL